MRLVPADAPDTTSAAVPVRIPQMRVARREFARRALIFDIENRPLSYWYDRPTAEVTVIAYKWLDQPKTHVLMQDVDVPVEQILDEFRPVYAEAEVVIGHNIRRHDLPILDGAYREVGQDGLTETSTIDTYGDMPGYKDIPKSLEYLAELLGAPYEKFHMTQHSWRQANRFAAKGIHLVRQRCAVDVQVSEWVYKELCRREWITGRTRRWKP